MEFKKKTDFQGVISTLKLYSHSIPLKQQIVGMISHPLISNVFLPLMKEEDLKLLPDKLKEKVQGELKYPVLIVDESISSNRELSRLAIDFQLKRFELMANGEVKSLFLYLHKPYKLSFLANCFDSLDEKTFNELLVSCWTEVEYPIQHPGEVEAYTLLWKLTRKRFLYDKDNKKDREVHDNLKSPVKIYRGLQHRTAKVKSLSWTLSEKVAQWFADRWQKEKGKKKGIVYSAEIDVEDIFFYTNDRSEEEVIVNPEGIRNLKKINGLK